MNSRRLELLAKLVEIEADLLREKNSYDLNSDNKADIKIVIDTLKYLINNMDKLKHIDNVYFIPDLIPIHLENYPIGDDREEYIYKSLVQLFIDCVLTVKEEGKTHVQIFCDLLNGHCIDGRTRSAFDYALAFREMPTFTQVIYRARDKLELHQKKSYSYILVSLLNTEWRQQYRADKGNVKVAEKGGNISLDEFDIVDGFLRNILGLEFNNDFILAFNNLKSHHTDFLTIVLSKIDNGELIFNNIDYSDKLSEAKSINPTSLSLQPGLQQTDTVNLEIYQNILNLNQNYYDSFLKKSFMYLLQNLAADFILQQSAITNTSLHSYFYAASPQTLSKLIQDAYFKTYLSEISPYALSVIFEAIFDKFKIDGTMFKHFLTLHFSINKVEQTLLHIAAAGNNINLINKILTLENNFNVFQLNSERNSAISTAAYHKNWDAVEVLSEATPTELQHHLEYGNTLIYAAANKQWNLVIKLIGLKAEPNLVHNQSHLTALHYAIQELNLDVFQALIAAGSNINFSSTTTPSLIHFVITHTNIKADTLVYLLMLNEVNVNLGFQNESPLLAAVRTGQFEKLQTLLLKPSLDDSAIISADSLAIINAEKNQFNYITNLLKTYRFIYNILHNRIQEKENLTFLNTVNHGLILDLFTIIANKHNTNAENKAVGLFVLNECLYHFHKAPRDNSNLFRFKPKRFLSTTAALNKTFLIAANSTETNRNAWLLDIRQFALNKLEQDTSRLQPAEKLHICTTVREEPIFALKREFSLWPRTNAQTKIDNLISECKASLNGGPSFDS